MAVTDPVSLPGTGLVVGAGLVALLVSATALVPPSGRIGGAVRTVGYLGTWVHELGHAAASILTGGGVYRIDLDSPDSGVAHYWYYSWFSNVVTKVAGYAAPPLLGLGAASLISRGHTPLVLAIAVGVAVLALPVSGDLFVAAVPVTVGGTSAAALIWGPVELQHWLAYTLAWLLLLSELPALWHLIANRWRGTVGDHDDADGLADLTLVPGVLWIAGWFALAGWAVWTATPLLWG
jgi:hypothetical protein